jgi:glycosyltransferase involved in cell wall biosynthesis
MIPTYNCAPLLAVCLESVLAQDLGPEQMEIVVIDDHSEHDDPSSIVEQLGGGRVSFLSHPDNLGPVTTFNDCIMRARGEFVHVLHGDDFVADGFYAEIRRLVTSAPSAAVFTTRYATVDDAGAFLETIGAIDDTSSTSAFTLSNPLQFCSTVIRRSAVEQCGGFIPNLIHTADYEMWVRLSARFGLKASPEVLASYRIFDTQHSAGLRRTAGNLIDLERATVLLAQNQDLPLSDDRLRVLRNTALRQAAVFREQGDKDAEVANLRYWSARAATKERVRRQLGSLRTLATSRTV